MNPEFAKLLTTALVQFIDRERSEGTMCCGNGDCKSLEEALKADNFFFVEAFIEGKLSRLTEFEDKLVAFAIQCEGEWNTAKEEARKWSRELLDLAKKELLSYADESNPAIEAMADLERTYWCNPDKLPKWLKDDIARKELNAHTKGYNKGYKDASEEYNKCASYHFPTVTIRPLCWEPGGTCTNPHMDCINCPKKTTGGNFSLNTSSGTSTLKAEG